MRFYQESLESTAADDPYWVARDFAAGVGEITAPVQLVAGWNDLFTPWQLEDFVALRQAGRQAQLIVGPWTHTSQGLVAASTRETLGWMRAHLLGDRRLVDDAPVRVYMSGAREWRRLADWPPADARPWRLHLHPHGGLAEEPSPVSDPDRYCYDPGHPRRRSAARRCCSAGRWWTTARSRPVTTSSPTRPRLFNDQSTRSDR